MIYIVTVRFPQRPEVTFYHSRERLAAVGPLRLSRCIDDSLTYSTTSTARKAAASIRSNMTDALRLLSRGRLPLTEAAAMLLNLKPGDEVTVNIYPANIVRSTDLPVGESYLSL